MTAFITSAGDFKTQPVDTLASINLPPSLFTTIDTSNGRQRVGIFFALYDEPTLFPIRNVMFQDKNRSKSSRSLHPEIASALVAATVGSGLDFHNLDHPVEVNLRISSKNFTVNHLVLLKKLSPKLK